MPFAACLVSLTLYMTTLLDAAAAYAMACPSATDHAARRELRRRFAGYAADIVAPPRRLRFGLERFDFVHVL